MSNNILEVADLHVDFETYQGSVKALRGVSFTLEKGESLAIVGESGSGKSVTASTIMGLIPKPPGKIMGGKILFEGEDILLKDEKAMRELRGGKIGMIFQDPMTSLNPTMKIGNQIAESLIIHKGLSKKEALFKSLELLRLVHIPHPDKRLHQYPYQLSGGMRQRVMIAIALACEPQLLIADEPTTALDVTIQAQILALISDIKNKKNMSTILITHDLGIVANIADKVAVMYGGKILETGTVEDIFNRPKHPYTWGLLRSIPRMDAEYRNSRLYTIEGSPPDLLSPRKGCPFVDRCEYAMKECMNKFPPQFEFGNGHKSHCWLNHEDAPKVEGRGN